MHHALNMENKNIGVLQHILTGLCNVVVSFEHKMNDLFQNGTDQLIKVRSTSAPRYDFEVWLSTLI